MEHARLLRRFRQILAKLGCDQFEVYEQVGVNWNTGEATGRYVQIMRFRDRKHQVQVQQNERGDPAAQAVIAEFCRLINFPYQQQQGLFAVGYYTSVLPSAPPRPQQVRAAPADPFGAPAPEPASGMAAGIPAGLTGTAIVAEAERAIPEVPEIPEVPPTNVTVEEAPEHSQRPMLLQESPAGGDGDVFGEDETVETDERGEVARPEATAPERVATPMTLPAAEPAHPLALEGAEPAEPPAATAPPPLPHRSEAAVEWDRAPEPGPMESSAAVSEPEADLAAAPAGLLAEGSAGLPVATLPAVDEDAGGVEVIYEELREPEAEPEAAAAPDPAPVLTAEASPPEEPDVIIAAADAGGVWDAAPTPEPTPAVAPVAEFAVAPAAEAAPEAIPEAAAEPAPAAAPTPAVPEVEPEVVDLELLDPVGAPDAVHPLEEPSPAREADSAEPPQASVPAQPNNGSGTVAPPPSPGHSAVNPAIDLFDEPLNAIDVPADEDPFDSLVKDLDDGLDSPAAAAPSRNGEAGRNGSAVKKKGEVFTDADIDAAVAEAMKELDEFESPGIGAQSQVTQDGFGR